MGKYINSTSNGAGLGASYREKLNGLLADGATQIPQPTTFQPNLVCVVDNGFFAAAAYAYSDGELKAFSSPSDSRPKTWLTYPHAEQLAS